MNRIAALPFAHLGAAAFCLGLALALAVRAPGLGIAVSAVGLAVLATVAPRARGPCVAAALLTAGWWLASERLQTLEHSALAPLAGQVAPIHAEVTGPARRGTYAVRVPVRIRTLWKRGLSEPAQLELPPEVAAPPQGALIAAVATIRRPDGRDQESGFDEAEYLRRRGAHAVLRADRYEIVGRRGGVGGAADRIRRTLAGSIAPGLEGERRALVAGIVLGEDEGLDPELQDRFRASGLYHLLAVSGQNVAYVAAGVLLAAWVAGIPRWLALAAGLGAVVAYVAAVGWQPSVVRAGVAGSLTILAWLLGRARDRWYFALVGAAVLLAWNPYSLLEPGFQLSFAAVAAIFCLVPWLERRLDGYPLPARLTAVVLVSGACGLVTAPIVWLHFGAVPVLSVVANALAAPVVAPILGLGLGASAIGLVLPGAAHALAWVNGWLVEYLAWCARAIGGLPFAELRSGTALAGVACAVAGAVAVPRLRARWPGIAARARGGLLPGAVAVALGVPAWVLWPDPGPPPAPPTGLRVTFLDVGQGDAALLEVPEGAVLVDQGPPEARVDARLDDLGIDRLAALVLTHPERDHIGGAGPVLRATGVGLLLDPRQPADSPYEEDAIREAAARNVRIVTARVGQRYRLGDLELRVLWPDGSAQPGDDPNDHPIVLLASYGAIDLLLAADAETNVTGRLELPPVEVLKLAHHGSADDGLPHLLERLRPRIAVISVGRDNQYGHPTVSTLAALARARGLAVFRTDLHGTVIVESDGRRLSVRTEA